MAAADDDYAGEWYLPVDVDGGRLYVLERGSGPFLLAVHGGPGHDHGYLRDALGPLEERHRVVYFDQRGSLRSPFPPERVTFDALVDDLAPLVGELGEAPVPVVAHSMGSVVTAAAVERHPQLFAQVVLLNPAPLRSGQPRPPDSPARPEVAAERARAGIDGKPRSPRDATRAWRISFAGTNLYHVERWARLAGGQVFYNNETARAVWSTMPGEYDYVDALRRHPFPVTIVVGDHDRVDPGGEHARAAAGGAVRTIVVPRAGHALWIDQPERFSDIVQEAVVAAPALP